MSLKLSGAKKIKVVVAIVAIVLVIAVVLGARAYYKTNGPTILMYHHLAPAGTYDGTDDEYNGAILAVENFDAQMKWLCENGYNTMFLSEVMSYLDEAKPLPDKTVIITFDDGYESNYIYAFNILQKYKLKANMAIVVRDSERRDEKPDITPYTDNTLRHMTFTQAKAMSDSGFVEIGSHSYDGHGQVNVGDDGTTKPFFVNKKYNTKTHILETHEDYMARITNDLTKSREVLMEKLGKEVNYLAYPYGLVDENVLAATKAAGFKLGVIIKNDVIHKNSDLLLLPRHNVEPSLTLEDFIDLVRY